jgi:hypothetical protein
MDSIANPSYLAYEFVNFQNDTNLIEKNRKIPGYQIEKNRVIQLTSSYLSQKFNSIPAIPNDLNSLYKNHIIRKCFNKCKKFVLEDWVDYKEMECTLNCTSEIINASKVLDTLY